MTARRDILTKNDAIVAVPASRQTERRATLVLFGMDRVGRPPPHGYWIPGQTRQRASVAAVGAGCGQGGQPRLCPAPEAAAVSSHYRWIRVSVPVQLLLRAWDASDHPALSVSSAAGQFGASTFPSSATRLQPKIIISSIIVMPLRMFLLLLGFNFLYRCVCTLIIRQCVCVCIHLYILCGTYCKVNNILRCFISISCLFTDSLSQWVSMGFNVPHDCMCI